MSYICIFIATIMFSFVGTLVKIASPMVPAAAITFSRFFFGVIFLFLLCLFTRHTPRLLFNNRWIWLAILGKCVNYLCENSALQKGASFGNIITYPVQAVSLCFFSALLFREKIGPRKLLSTVLCVSGILIISWNGTPLDVFFGNSLPVTMLFVFSAIGAATFVLSQKMLIQTLPSTDMNLSVFLVGALISAVPMCAEAGSFSSFRLSSLLALIGLGVITGGAFLLVAQSLKKLSLVVSGMIQNSCAIFALIWAAVFWHEPITVYVVVGTAIFLCGLVFINISPKKGMFVN